VCAFRPLGRSDAGYSNFPLSSHERICRLDETERFPPLRNPALDQLALNDLFEDMSVALPLLFRALTHEGYGAVPGQVLDQAQRKLLAMVFYSLTVQIDWAIHEQLFPIIVAELSPADLI
jgi:hypothetical protein